MLFLLIMINLIDREPDGSESFLFVRSWQELSAFICHIKSKGANVEFNRFFSNKRQIQSAYYSLSTVAKNYVLVNGLFGVFKVQYYT